MPTIMVSNATELQNVNLNLAGVYQQTANIDLTGVTFTPLGTGTTTGRFAGAYDGAGYTISNLTINTPASDYVGLFGSSVGTITHVAVVGGSVTGKDNVGDLCGRNYGTVSYCYATGNATAGGLVGINYATISYCYATGDATAAYYAGGLVGINYATISYCYATGNATATNYAGGLVGINYATISYCYATGNATATNYAGGLIGYNYTDAIYAACFATGNFSGTYSNRLCGRDLSTAISTGACLTVAQSKDYQFPNAFDWDFVTNWEMAVVIPTITGLTCSQAGAALAAVGCTLGTVTEQYHATVPAGQIISQGTAAGGTAGTPKLKWQAAVSSPKTGDTVDVVVSLGNSVSVPNVKGLTQADATSLLSDFYFTATVVEATSETVAAGIVMSQSPAGGTNATYQSAVTITVSTGRAFTEVPGVLGLTTANATSAIEAEGLVASNTTAYSADFAAGLVISQSPAADTTVALGSTVNIVTSLGVEQKTVPNVVGLTQAAAESAITGVSLVPSATTANSNTVAIGKVISQDPAAASTVDTGSTVDIVVSLGALVPDIVDEYYLAGKALVECQSLVYASTMAYSATVASGYIISQSPAAGASVAPGSTITATVSRGAQVGPLMYTLNTVKTVLSRSSAFRTWAGVATEALALGHIGILDMDADYLPMAVISPGNWEREVVTLSGKSLTRPAVVIEFCKGVTRTDSEATVFATLLAAVDSIMLDIEAQGLWINLKWAPLNEDTPRRAGYSAANADWVGFSIVIEGDENEEI